MILVVVATRSRAARECLCEILSGDPEVAVADAVETGGAAILAVARHRPALLLLDADIADADAENVTRQIMNETPTPIMVLADPASVGSATRAQSALSAGGLVVVEMPQRGSRPGSNGARGVTDASIVAMAKAMAAVKVVRRWAGRQRALTPASSGIAGATSASKRPRLVVIASSTGGPAALRTVLSELPPDLPAAVLVVQHIARSFIGVLAKWLSGVVRIRVKVAEEGDVLVPGTVYLAPDDWHLGVRRDGSVVLSDAPRIEGFRPSATHLFETAAREFGASALAVILTGMGSDGVEGLHVVREVGGRILAQDEESSVVYGMPREAARAGVVDEILPIQALGRRIVELVRGE